MQQKTKPEIDFSKIKTEWDFSKIYKNENDPKIEIDKNEVAKSVTDFVTKWQARDDYLTDPKVLKEALDDYEMWSRRYGVSGLFGFYFGLRREVDSDNAKLKAKSNLLEEFSVKESNKIQFFELKIAKIKDTKKFLEDEELLPYKHFLEQLFLTAKYQLSEKEEQLLNLLSKSYRDNWVDMTSQFMSKFNKRMKGSDGKIAKRTFSEALNLTNSTNKEVRDIAAKAVYTFNRKNSVIAEHEINAILHSKKTIDGLRGLERPDQSRHISDDMDSSVVDALIKTMTDNFDICHKYYEFKAKLLGVEKLEIYERNLPYLTIDKKYSFKEAFTIVYDCFKNQGSDFADIFVEMFERGNVDVYPKKGKIGGAFCAYEKLESPIYVLLNFTESYDDIRTLSHEFGHCINDYYMQKKQNALNFGTSLATAEVASTFFEDVVYKKLIEKVSDEERLVLLIDKLDDIINTTFRQVSFYNFETRLHQSFRKKGFVNARDISKMFYEESKKQLGSAINYTKNFEHSWVYVSHFRRYFYVYTYASGLLISKAMQSMLSKDAKFIEKIKVFLSSGSESSPKDTFLQMGIDISKKEFWENGVAEIRAMVEEAELLARKLGKI